MTDDNIDYDRLASLVALKLANVSNASLQGQAALDDAWLHEQMTNWFIHNASFVARYVCNNYEFGNAFKSNLKTTINTIY